MHFVTYKQHQSDLNWSTPFLGGYRSTESGHVWPGRSAQSFLSFCSRSSRPGPMNLSAVHPYPSSIKIDHDDHVYIIIYSCIRKVKKCIWHQLQIVQMFTWRCWPFGSFASQVHCVLALLSDEEIAFRPPAQHLAADNSAPKLQERHGKNKKQSTSIDSIRRNSHCLSLISLYLFISLVFSTSFDRKIVCLTPAVSHLGLTRSTRSTRSSRSSLCHLGGLSHLWSHLTAKLSSSLSSLEVLYKFFKESDRTF